MEYDGRERDSGHESGTHLPETGTKCWGRQMGVASRLYNDRCVVGVLWVWCGVVWCDVASRLYSDRWVGCGVGVGRVGCGWDVGRVLNALALVGQAARRQAVSMSQC